MSDKICIFAGTTEGRKLATLLRVAAQVTVCVATAYGEILLDGIDGVRVHTGRMDAKEMADFFAACGFDRIIDATHPYAAEATENIAAAARSAHIPLMRILREKDGTAADAVYLPDAAAACDYLAALEGNILLTTGAKELSSFKALDPSRVFARVLPLAASLSACAEAGILQAHIFAAQGPFTEEMNLAHLHAASAKYIVTKDSGKVGGFDEKIAAARAAGAVAVIIGQPPQTDGLTFDEAVADLQKTYDIAKREILLVGVGPGSGDLCTPAARAALDGCDALFGAPAVTALLHTQKPCFDAYTPEKVRAILCEHPSIRRAAVAFRGDTSFFSGAAKMIKEFANENVTVIPGISSLSLFAARLGVPLDGAEFVSLHGRDANIVGAADEHQKLFVLCGGANTPSAVCRRLCDYGYGDLAAAVGERLSYPDEKVTRGSLSALCKQEYDRLSLLYIENPSARRHLRVGIDDGEFVRADTPMTKSEVRAISLSKLALPADAVVWDIGAGTGSVSVECALAACRGQVFAVEKEADAAELIEKNKVKFKTENLTVIRGQAPDVLRDLPAPTHAFIGGSGGKLKEILDLLLEKNPRVKIVMNTVTLESQGEAFAEAGARGFDLFEAVTVNIARAKAAGAYHLWQAQNPVTVFVMQKEADK